MFGNSKVLGVKQLKASSINKTLKWKQKNQWILIDGPSLKSALWNHTISANYNVVSYSPLSFCKKIIISSTLRTYDIVAEVRTIWSRGEIRIDQLKEEDTRVVHLAHACWGPGSLGLANQRFASPLPLFAIHQISLRYCGNGNLLGGNVSLTLSCPALVFGKYKSNDFLYIYG